MDTQSKANDDKKSKGKRYDTDDGRRQPSNEDRARLTVLRGIQNGQVFQLSLATHVFGRTEGYRVDDPLASRRHMEITRQDNEYILSDLLSMNGTYLNGKRIETPIVLKHGDIIRVGETILSFEEPHQQSAVLTYGAELNHLADHSQSEATIQIKHYDRLRSNKYQ